MEQNKRHNNRVERRIRRMEDKLDIIMCDLERVIHIVSGERYVRQRRQEMETDLALARMKASAERLKDMAEKEAKRVQERYGMWSEG